MESEENLAKTTHMTLALTHQELQADTIRTVILPGGHPVDIEIPAGTHAGQTIRLENQADYPDPIVFTIVQDDTPNHEADSATTDEMMKRTMHWSKTANATVLSRPLTTTTKNKHATIPLKRLALLPSLLILLIGSGIIGYTTAYRPYMQHRDSTATAEAKLQQTVQAKATRAADFAATTTVQARATGTATAHHQQNYDDITSAFPSINDDLHTPNELNWDTGSGCSFSHASYSASVTQNGFFVPCIAKNTSMHNFVYQVDMKITQGDAGGLIVHARNDNTQSYIFVVGQDGSYSIYYYSGQDRKAAQTLTDGYSNLIVTGYNHTNTIGVLASGTSLDFYINKKYVTNVIDSNLLSGQIGVLANNYKHPTTVIYSHAKVWKLG